MRAFIFPGQGSQAVGMGKALAEASPVAREVFGEVDEALGQHLFRLMAEGPGEDLQLTANAQPAIMANAIATLRVAEREGGLRLADKADYVAGHSLGEYGALCAAGAFDLATTARLLRLRGEAMQAAVPVGEGAMAALLGADLAKAQAIASAAVAAIAAEGGDLGPPRRDRACGHFGQGPWRQARAAAAGVGAVPLSADAARRRGDGDRARRRADRRAAGAGLRQRRRRADC
jgi:[acyl-carrier-protein] S-malonyltransferase